MAQCCPTCGRAFKTAKAVAVPVDTASMTTAELYAHYKRTAPVEDVRFALRAGVDMSPALRDDWQALLGLAPTLTAAEAKRRLMALQARWRAERNAAELAKREARRIAETAARTTYYPIRINPARLLAFGPHTTVAA